MRLILDREECIDGRLERKVAVITRAASGLGRGTALCLAREGAAVVAADLNSQGGEQVIGEIAAAGEVLIAGGIGSEQPNQVATELKEAELFDPSTATFTRVGDLKAARGFDEAVALP